MAPLYTCPYRALCNVPCFCFAFFFEPPFGCDRFRVDKPEQDLGRRKPRSDPPLVRKARYVRVARDRDEAHHDCCRYMGAACHLPCIDEKYRYYDHAWGPPPPPPLQPVIDQQPGRSRPPQTGLQRNPPPPSPLTPPSPPPLPTSPSTRGAAPQQPSSTAHAASPSSQQTRTAGAPVGSTSAHRYPPSADAPSNVPPSYTALGAGAGASATASGSGAGGAASTGPTSAQANAPNDPSFGALAPVSSPSFRALGDVGAAPSSDSPREEPTEVDQAAASRPYFGPRVPSDARFRRSRHDAEAESSRLNAEAGPSRHELDLSHRPPLPAGAQSPALVSSAMTPVDIDRPERPHELAMQPTPVGTASEASGSPASFKFGNTSHSTRQYPESPNRGGRPHSFADEEAGQGRRSTGQAASQPTGYTASQMTEQAAGQCAALAAAQQTAQQTGQQPGQQPGHPTSQMTSQAAAQAAQQAAQTAAQPDNQSTHGRRTIERPFLHRYQTSP